MIDFTYAAIGFICGIFASIVSQQYGRPWLRKRQQARRKAAANAKRYRAKKAAPATGFGGNDETPK